MQGNKIIELRFINIFHEPDSLIENAILTKENQYF